MDDAPKWVAEVRAPQGGPIYTHRFEADYVHELFETMREQLDLENADRVDVAITRVDGSDA